MRVVFAGGGTGGHLYPAIALAQAVQSGNGSVLFVTGNRPIEDRVFEALHFRRVALAVGGIATVSLWRKLLALIQVVPAFWKSLRTLINEAPDFVALTGGYVAFPVGLAAVLLRRPLILIEPNVLAGRVSRWFGRFAHSVVTLSRDNGLQGRHRTIYGIPVRQRIVDLNEQPKSAKTTLLVLGGSQGAASLNEAVPAIIAGRAGLAVRHVTGPDKSTAVAAAYRDAGIDASVIAYADEMESEYAQASIVIARAGAGTISELMAAAIPAILVPYPYAADDHQTANASVFDTAGGGIVVPEGSHFADRLSEALDVLLDPAQREQCRAALQQAGYVFEPARILDMLREAL